MANKKTSKYLDQFMMDPISQEVKIRNHMKMTQSVVDSFTKLILGKKVVIVIEKKDMEMYKTTFETITKHQVLLIPYEVNLKMYELQIVKGIK